MKLLICLVCSDVFKLATEKHIKCKCGACGGQYLDDLNAVYWGKALPLGFANGSLMHAMLQQINLGDSSEKMAYGHNQWVTKGHSFESFIIPSDAPTMIKYETYKEYKKALES